MSLPGTVARQRYRRTRRKKPTAKDGPVRGASAICRVLRCSRRILYAWMRRPSDPLRLWSTDYESQPWALRSRLVAYRKRWQTPDDPALPRVRGWDAIGACVGVSGEYAALLAKRKNDPLPVGFSATGRREAYLHAILDWLDGQNRPHLRAMAERAEKKPIRRAA